MKLAFYFALCMYLATAMAFVSIQPRLHLNSNKITLQVQAKKEPNISKTKIPVETEAPKKNGIEPKYLAALGVFFLAALWDKQYMHGGIFH
jgi:hypothetical protein